MGQTKSKSNPAVNQQILASTTLRGLYASCEWDERSIRSLIIAKRLAPIVAGASDETRITNLTVIISHRVFFFFFSFLFFCFFFVFLCAIAPSWCDRIGPVLNLHAFPYRQLYL